MVERAANTGAYAPCPFVAIVFSETAAFVWGYLWWGGALIPKRGRGADPGWPRNCVE